ncbi:hypothetical protein D9M72_495860 [compost metagenome]
MALQKVQRCLVRDLGRVEIDHGIKHFEIRCMLAKIGAEPDLSKFVAEEAMAADEGCDLAGTFSGLSDHPCRGATDLVVIEPDITFTDAGREVRKQRENRDPALLQLLDRGRHRRIIRSNERNRLVSRRSRTKLFRNRRRCRICYEVDLGEDTCV